MTLYNVLEVPADASPDDIKKAYRKKARKSHPDHGGTHEEFKKVTEAYEILISKERRERYDKTGDTGTSSPGSQAEAQLAQLLSKIFESPKELDYLKETKSVLDTMEGQLRKSLTEQDEKWTRLRERKEKFQESNKDSENQKGYEYILEVLDANIQVAERQADKITEELKGVEEMKVLLDGLMYPMPERGEKYATWPLGPTEYVKWSFE